MILEYNNLIKYCESNNLDNEKLEQFVSENVHSANLHDQRYNIYQTLINNNKLKLFQTMMPYDIDGVIRYCKVADKFITKFHYKMNLEDVSKHQPLSENILTKFQNSLDWFNISIKQSLNPKLINKFYKKLNIKCILEYQDITDDIIEKFHYKIPNGALFQRNSKIIQKYHLKIHKPYMQVCHIMGPPNICETTNDAYVGYLHVSNQYKSLSHAEYYQIGHSYERACQYTPFFYHGRGFDVCINKIVTVYGKLLKVKIHPNNIIWTDTKEDIMHCNKITILEECT